jgi:PTS system nitrogen regulatory IIA component
MPNHFHAILRIIGNHNQVDDRLKGDQQVAPTGSKTKSVEGNGAKEWKGGDEPTNPLIRNPQFLIRQMVKTDGGCWSFKPTLPNAIALLAFCISPCICPPIELCVTVLRTNATGCTNMRLTIEATAQCLDLPVRKLERWISQGRIPIRKDGQTCVFNESALEKWAAGHHLPFRLSGEAATKEKSASRPHRADSLLAAMERGGVYYDVEGGDVESVLKTSAMRLPQFPEASRAVLHQRLLEREQLMSTGIGKGVAIPHPRTPLEEMGDESILATFFLRDSVDYGSIDDKPVFVLFILLCPTTKEHLNLLSRLAFCVRDDAFVSFLKTAPDAKALLSRIEGFEQQLDQS